MTEKKPKRPHTGARVALITLVTFGAAVVILATVKRAQETAATDATADTVPAPPEQVAQAALAPQPPVSATVTNAPTKPASAKAGPSKPAPVKQTQKTEELPPASTKGEDVHPSSIKAEVFTPAPEPAAGAHMESAREALVTIEGCLERKGDHFRLKETDGANAPKSRSWKTGFLTKRSRTLDVTDAPNGLILRGYNGRRVSITGTFVDGELHARSAQGATGACD